MLSANQSTFFMSLETVKTIEMQHSDLKSSCQCEKKSPSLGTSTADTRAKEEESAAEVSLMKTQTKAIRESLTVNDKRDEIPACQPHFSLKSNANDVAQRALT